MLHGHRITLLTGMILIVSVIQAEAKEAFIEMPSPCYAVEAVKYNRVYLKENEKDCDRTSKRELIQIDDGVDQVEVYAQGKLWRTQDLDKKEVDLEKIEDAVEEQKKNLNTEGIKNNDEASRRASEAVQKFHSEQYQSILNKEMARIKENLSNAGEKEDNKVIYSDANKTREPALRRESYLYIFVSSSMPQNTIRAYAQDAALLREQNIIIVLKGMTGKPSGIKETAKYVKNIIRKDPGCERKCAVYKVRFAIDPRLFEKYKITEVPVFVYDRDVKTMKSGVGGEIDNKTGSEYLKLEGDVSVQYALEMFRRETKENELDKLIGKISGEYGANN